MEPKEHLRTYVLFGSVPKTRVRSKPKWMDEAIENRSQNRRTTIRTKTRKVGVHEDCGATRRTQRQSADAKNDDELDDPPKVCIKAHRPIPIRGGNSELDL